MNHLFDLLIKLVGQIIDGLLSTVQKFLFWMIAILGAIIKIMVDIGAFIFRMFRR